MMHTGIISTQINTTGLHDKAMEKSRRKSERESIHSGQFMVSQFEAEEALDELVDSEVKMLDPEDPSLLKLDEGSSGMDIQLYVPQNLGSALSLSFQSKDNIPVGLLTSHLEIETTLTKLFKCMNLAYSQKLTSPKWNHFKGVRLRWKDKIRLNNVIWRCWHMQFILKRRAHVCQFASPLDVDVHSNPESVILEGKYWKRQLNVIKAEYRKWRQNYKSKTVGSLSFCSKSEFGFIEWSPLSERSLLLSDDWTSDTLFSTINVPFPFPDRREIARSAGIADFMQPSLGPLQPNLDDIDITFADLLENSRLPPVAEEEASAEILKNYDDDFAAITEAGQIDAINILGVTTNDNIAQNNHVATMINTPHSTLQFSAMEQVVVPQEESCIGKTTSLGPQSNSPNTIFVGEHNDSSLLNALSTKSFDLMNAGSVNCRTLEDLSNKSASKGRNPKNFQRLLRREPHNYDRAQPTPHQTTIYQQMLEEQKQKEKSQQCVRPNDTCVDQHKVSTLQEYLQFQVLYQAHKLKNPSIRNSDADALSSSNSEYLGPKNSNSNIFQVTPMNEGADTVKNYVISKEVGDKFLAKLTESQSLQLNVKKELSSSSALSVFNAEEADGSKTQTWAGDFETAPYMFCTTKVPKKSVSSGTDLTIDPNKLGRFCEKAHIQYGENATQLSRLNLYPITQASSFQAACDQQSIQISSPNHHKKHPCPKEIIRSNSLPLNASPQHINFEDVKCANYQPKSAISYLSSSSIHQYERSTADTTGDNINPEGIQAAISEPVINNTRTHVFASNQAISTSHQISSSNDVLTSFNESLARTKTLSGTTIFPLQSDIGQIDLTQPVQMQPQNSKSMNYLKSISLPMPITTKISNNCRSNKISNYSSSIAYSTKRSVSPDFLSKRDGPPSPLSNIKVSRDHQRRAGHIHAEQKRRFNIKNGFDTLHSLIPQLLQQNSNAKLSKAAMLQRGADHIKQLRNERNFLHEQISKLSFERDTLNSSLAHLHTILPVNGAPLSKQRSENVIQLFEKYVRFRTLNNWKFWVLGLILEPLLISYITSVSSGNMEELRRTVFLWIDQHCSLIDLRPAISKKLKYLSMETDILSDPPTTLREEVIKAINNSFHQHPNLHGL